LDDFDLFDYTESFNEFDDDLNETLEDAELDALSKQISEIDEQEVNYSKKKNVSKSLFDYFFDR